MTPIKDNDGEVQVIMKGKVTVLTTLRVGHMKRKICNIKIFKPFNKNPEKYIQDTDWKILDLVSILLPKLQEQTLRIVNPVKVNYGGVTPRTRGPRKTRIIKNSLRSTL